MTEAPLRAHMAALPSREGPGPHCLSDDLIFDAASGALSSQQLASALDHVSGCAWCSCSWSVAQSAQAAQQAPAVSLRASRLRRRWIAAGAGAVLALAAAALLILREPSDQAPYRSVGSASLQSELPTGASLPRDAFELRWASVGPEYRYDLQLTDSELEIVYGVRDLTQPSHQVPASALVEVDSGAQLVWTVQARSGTQADEIRGSFVIVLD